MAQRNAKIAKLVALWEEMEDTAYQMEEWLAKPEFAEILNTEISPNTMTEEDIKHELEKLKVRVISYIWKTQTNSVHLS